jgi:small subunit ribosomal protein S21
MSYRKEYDHRPRRTKMNSKRPSNVTTLPKDGEHVDRTIKRFLRKVKKSGIGDILKKRRFFEKPSVKRRKKAKRREAVIKKANNSKLSTKR